MNVRMVDVALEAMRDVDVWRWSWMRRSRPGPGDRYLLDVLKDVKTPTILALNKVDLDREAAAAADASTSTSRRIRSPRFVPLSAADGTNVDVLERLFLQHLPEGEPLYPPDYLTDQTERFFVGGDRARAGAAAHARRAAVLDRGGRRPVRGERRDGSLKLYCTILVERESQKPIVVGQGPAR